MKPSDPETKETIIHRINACPDDIDCKGKVVWMTFQKVAQTAEAMSDGHGSYGKDDARVCMSNFKSLSRPTESSGWRGLLTFANKQLWAH